MPEFTLAAEVRSEDELGSGPVGRMRRTGVVPGVVYGLGRDSVAIKLGEHDFEAVVRSMQGVGVIQLTVGNLMEPVLVKEVARHPVTRRPLNIDFIRVRPRQADHRLGRVFLTATRATCRGRDVRAHAAHAPVEGLPARIPPIVRVDASQVDPHATRCAVRDIPLPEGVTALLPGEHAGRDRSATPQ